MTEHSNHPMVRKLLTIDQAAAFLHVTHVEMVELIQNSRIPYAVYADQTLLIDEDLREYQIYQRSQERINQAKQEIIELSRRPIPEEIQEAMNQFPTRGYVYILRYQSYCKIGKAVNVQNRLGELGIQMPEHYELIHVIAASNPLNAERFLHRQFAHKRVRGEWFALDETDISALKRLKTMPNPPRLPTVPPSMTA